VCVCVRVCEKVCVYAYVCVCTSRDQEVCAMKRCVFESLDMKCACIVLLLCVCVFVCV